MNKLSAKQLKLASESTLILPKTTPIKVNLKKRQTVVSTPRSLSNSKLSIKSETSSHYIKLPNSFYNDHKNIYQTRSRILSEKTVSYQSKNLSVSQRHRYQSSRTEDIVGKRQRLRFLDNNGNLDKDISKSSALSQRFRDIASNRYKKLLYGKEMTRVNKALLQKGIKRSFSQHKSKLWASPFVGQSKTQKLRGNPLVSKPVEPLIPQGPRNQLKVLNLDRIFRMRDGKLTNIVPLPVVKLSQISARESIIKTVKHQDKIHEAIAQYNNLLKMAKMKKTIPKLGVKGKKFTKSPTIQELMGLKLAPSKSIFNEKEYSYLDPSVLIEHSFQFQSCVKQEPHLTTRIIAGLVRSQDGGISLSAFALFWQLFVSRTAKFQEKINFLMYFFVPATQEAVQLSILRIILQQMCKELPAIQKLDLKTEVLSQDEKSRIFLQALIKVLFGQVLNDQSRGLNRVQLKLILEANPDACDLLIRLLQIDQ